VAEKPAEVVAEKPAEVVAVAEKTAVAAEKPVEAPKPIPELSTQDTETQDNGLSAVHLPVSRKGHWFAPAR
jgi:hypothetical protein